MAFTTEFVMGAGGAEVEEIPVSMTSSGTGTYPLTAVNADSGAWVWVDGVRKGSVLFSLRVGGLEYRADSGSLRMGGGGYFTGTVAVEVEARSFGSSTTFTGTVYVIRT